MMFPPLPIPKSYHSLVTLGVYLEWSMALLTKGGKVPQPVALLLSGSISQTRKKILQLYRFNFLYVHIRVKLNGLKNWWFDENAHNHFITNKLLAHHGFITGLAKRKNMYFSFGQYHLFLSSFFHTDEWKDESNRHCQSICYIYLSSFHQNND